MPAKGVPIEPGQKRPALSRIGQRRQVVIPKAVFELLRLREGDFVEVTAEAGRVFMKPKKLAHTDDVLTPAEAKKVRHALKQVKERKTKPWTNVKHELGL
jgi:AbrB family looped-hinge helix DNA binding protein